jgi:hypothetical protein
MIRAAPSAESFEEDEAPTSAGWKSGTRRVALDPEGSLRDSERPTRPVPMSSSMVAYMGSPPLIGPAYANVSSRYVIKGRDAGTARLAIPGPPLLPHLLEAPLGQVILASEHAFADEPKGDGPGSALEYLKVLGSVERVLYVSGTMARILSAGLDPREGFILSLIDGELNIDGLLDVSPMPTHETLRILQRLRARGLIALRDATAL